MAVLCARMFALWTIVMSIIFWTSLVHRLEMPDFDDTRLALLGISAGTYLGFKFPREGWMRLQLSRTDTQGDGR